MSDLRRRLGLLADYDFRHFFASAVASQFGLRVSLVATPLVAVLTLAADEFQVGLLTAFSTVAFLVVGLPAGAWVDRLRRRTVLMSAFLFQAGVTMTVPIAYWAGLLTIWQLYAVALLSGVSGVFLDVAQQSYLPQLVGRENLVEANTKLHGVRAVSQVAGPAAAGQAVQVLTAPVALLVNALGFLMSTLFVSRIRRPEERRSAPVSSSLLREIGEGLRFVLGHRKLRSIAACNATFNFAWAAYGAMLMVYLARDIGLPAGLIGVFLMFGGAGSLLGVSIGRRVVAVVGEDRAIWAVPAASTPFLLLIPFARPGVLVWMSAAGLLAVSVGQVIYNVTQVSLRQRLTPERLLGRMSATMRFLVWGVMPMGAIAGGMLGALLGVRPALWIMSILASLAFVPVYLSRMPGLDALTGPQEQDRSVEAV